MLINVKIRLYNKSGFILIIFICLLTIFALFHLAQSMIFLDHCYTDIGCFPLSREFFHPRHRPFNVRPWHRRHIRTQFELFNRHHPEGYMLVAWDSNNLQQSHFDPKLETKVIIPGWLDNISRAVWVKKLRDALLWQWAPVNIIVLRWVNFTPYTIATANTRVVGAELASLIKFLERQLHYDRAYFHIIGHSLGAHIGGYAGDRVPGLGRITALDPARPFFQGMPKSVRLDRGDAKFVDVIHSDFTPENSILLIMSYGMTIPVGHLDFYPNGPPLFQPGCLRDTLNSVQNGIARGLQHNSLSVAFLEASRYLTACDHQRSHEWFIESITNRKCQFVGVRCNEFEGMINGRCTCDDSRSACAIMGINADQMYLHGVHDDVWPVRGGAAAAAGPVVRGTSSSSFKASYKHNEPTTNSGNNLNFAKIIKLKQKRPQSVSSDALTVAQQFALEVPNVPEYYRNNEDELNKLISLEAAKVDLMQDTNNEKFLANLMMKNGDYDNDADERPTREEVYYKLKQQIDKFRSRPEPMIYNDKDDNEEIMKKREDQQQQEEEVEDDYFDEIESRENSTKHNEIVAKSGLKNDDDDDDKVKIIDHLEAAATDSHDHNQIMSMALEDNAFVDFLRTNFLGHQQEEGRTGNVSNDGKFSRKSASPTASMINDSSIKVIHMDEAKLLDEYYENGNEMENKNNNNERRRQSFGHPVQFNGHPFLKSNMHRDTENWYEGTSKWFLKTNNRPLYCSNQYQLLIYLGPLKTTNGRNLLRANLIVSLIGSRGQLLNQRFIPRGSTLSSFTMQPFFILLEGSYSLGEIQSISIAWEARNDPDPIQATVTFQTNPLMQTIQSKVPAYQAKNQPWLPQTMKYDKSEAFKWNKLSELERVRRKLYAQNVAQAMTLGENSNYVPKMLVTGNKSKRPNILERREGRRRGGERQLKKEVEKRSLHSDYDYTDYLIENSSSDNDNELQMASSEQRQRQVDGDLNFRDENYKQRQKDFIADDDSESMFVPLLEAAPKDQLVPINQLTPDDLMQTLDPQTMLYLHNIDSLLTTMGKQHESLENNLVINQVIVSPIQATYGRSGRNAKAFCPPGGHGQRLSREQTIKLEPSLLDRCHVSQLPIQVN